MEKWLPVKGYEESYEISSKGQVRSKDRYTPTWNGQVFKKGVVKNLKENKDGYLRVWLSKESKKKPFFVHRLVAEAFLPNENNHPVVNHIDGNKSNNDMSNLEWCTRSENDKHAFKLGLRKVTCGGTSKSVIKIDPKTGYVLDVYRSMSEAARENDITVQSISYCINGKQEISKGFKWVLTDEGVTTIRKE
jgi:hypothetical protein